MHSEDDDFFWYIKRNRLFLWWALAIGIVYFIGLKLLYPVPSFFSDSYTFVGAAARNQPVSFRPIMYSKLIQFFKLFSKSDLALVAAQYASTLLANLFIFFSASWLFSLGLWNKRVLFFLLICHPFFVFSSNYISSDVFFTSLTVVWFTLLLWIMYKPAWYLVVVHLVLLCVLFLLRYNAIYFPFFTAFAVLCSHLGWRKKLAIITVGFMLVAVCIEATSRATKKYAGPKVFSPFAGWQLANNALHVVRNEHIDPTTIKEADVKNILLYTQHYFDTTKDYVPKKGTAWYMWYPGSPLKQYMKVYAPRSDYFNSWAALGPVYGRFGRTIILQHPIGYLKNFVVPNASEYIYPQLEVYGIYMEGRDTVAPIATKYFHYTSNKASRHRPTLYNAVFVLSPLLFTGVNIFLVLLLPWYLFSGRYKLHSKLINRFILLFTCYFVANFFFIVLLAPSVFRYHLSVLIGSFPVILFLVSELRQRLFGLPHRHKGT